MIVHAVVVCLRHLPILILINLAWPLADPPSLVDDFRTTPFQTPVDIPVLDNDLAADGGYQLTLDSDSIISGPTNGTVVVNQDGTVTYTPDDGFTGTDTFDYEACDNRDPPQCDVATVTVLVESDNNPPIASEFV